MQFFNFNIGVVERLTLLLHRKVPGSNLGPETGYPDLAKQELATHTRRSQNFYSENLKETENLGDTDVDRRIILKWILGTK
jgi:hypothetical protein